jgi:hypothetical protein
MLLKLFCTVCRMYLLIQARLSNFPKKVPGPGGNGVAGIQRVARLAGRKIASHVSGEETPACAWTGRFHRHRCGARYICTHHRTRVRYKLKFTKRHTPSLSRHTIHILSSVTRIAVSGPECFGVPPSDPRFNPDIVDETLAEVLAHEEGQPVSVHQVSSQVQDDLLLVTIIDAAGPCAVSSKSLSQTLMIQALNPKSYLRRRFTNAPLRELQAPLSSPSANHSPQVNSCFETTVA